MLALPLHAFLSVPATLLPLSLAVAQTPRHDVALRVRMDHGAATFRIADPDATESAAERENEDLVDKAGHIPPNTRGYRMTSRVVVGVDSMPSIESLHWSRRDLCIEPLDGVPGFWIIDAGSVGDAVALADELARDPRLSESYLDIESPRELRGLNDPGVSKQWHLYNRQLPIADINLVDAWLAGYTGTGITVGIVEDGWQTNHSDLIANYNAAASQPGGFNSSHATSCAGLVAAAANNGKCGVGVACTAKISKLIFGSMSQNASAFAFKNDLNAIKSNSWGPLDPDHIAYLSSVERSAIDNAVANGRGGKGTIFVWAAGNGGALQRCDYDPYASNRKVCCVGAIGDQDKRAMYNELGSSMLIVAPSDGNVRGIYTTDSGNRCMSSFGGTSAACPIAAGVIALMLQANPNLGWRDVQHILVNSARKCDPGNAMWVVNGGGHDVNYNYGFGAIDAWAAVQLALGWTNVAPEVSFVSANVAVNAMIPDNTPAGLTRVVNVPADFTVESVELVVDITTTAVGDLKIVLTSPFGTESLLAAPRGDPTDDYTKFVFTSRRHWDERSVGTWRIQVSDLAPQELAKWNNFQLAIHGTP